MNIITRKLMAIAVALSGGIALSAQPLTDGGLYQIVNGNYSSHAMAIPASTTGDVICKTADATDKSQLWLAEANADSTAFALRNFLSGTYLKANTSTSGAWQSVELFYGDDDMSLIDMAFEAVANSSQYVFRPASVTSGQYRFAHENGSSKVVTWGNGAGASKWTINLINSFTDDEIKAQKASWNSWMDNYVNGGVYRIVNVAQPGRCITAPTIGQCVGTQPTADTDEDIQLWQLTYNRRGDGVYLRNLSTGAYLTSPRVQLTTWSVTATATPDDGSMAFKIATDAASGKEIFSPIGHNENRKYAHNDGSNNIVCWSSDNTNSRWTFNLVETITVKDAADKLAAVDNVLSQDPDVLQTHLDALFADKACTLLNDSIDDLENNEHYLALPSKLQEMARKVSLGDWSEPDWDAAHARKFRVQLYEPYSRGQEGSSMMCVQAYTNMNNPTGIIADNRSALYIMVEDEVPEGALLTVGTAPGNSAYNDFNGQQQLHRGLNIVPIFDDHSLIYIYYTVDTWDTAAKVRKYPLDNYSPIKIHIEGGDINGHFNAIGDALYAPDTNEDWQYYRSRARHEMFDLIGKHVILHFHLNNTEQPGKDLLSEFDETVRDYDIPAIIDYWDDLIFYQKMLMGVLSDDDINSDRAKRIGRGANSWTETLYDPLTGDDICPADYHRYINARMMAIGRNSGYMSGASWTTNYNATTYHAILTGIIDDNAAGQLWGPAHEHGHVNQQPLKIAGTTEESNNVFSNIAVYYRGIHTARTDLPYKQRNVFNSGKTFLENDVWGTTRMFYQLWLYYHAAGHNRKFYPRLFELLRQYPLEKRGGGAHLESRYDLLHFAKMCCVAAEEDLTDFFTSWGFFVVQDDFYIDDYSRYHSYLPQEDIDAVKAEIAAYNYPKNTAIIFIDDRPGSTRQSWSGDMAIDNAGELGGLNDFINGNITDGSYAFTLNGNTVTIDGASGGAGFLLYDAEGNLIGFSNEPTFTLSDDAAQTVATGGATVQTVSTDNSETAAVDVVEAGTTDQRLTALNYLMANVRALLDKVDPTNRIVGHLHPTHATALETAYNEMAAKIEAGITDDEITAGYRSLAEMYYALLNNDDAHIAITPGASYNLSNREYTSRILSTNGTILTSPVSTNLTAAENRWTFIPVEEKTDAYYIRNEGTQKYIGEVTEQSVSIPLTDTPVEYTLQYITHEYIAPYPTAQGASKALHINGSGNIVSWNTSSTPTQWVFSLAMSPEEVAARDRLRSLIEANETLVNETGEIELSEPVQLTLEADSLYTNAPYTAGNNNDTYSGLAMLVDGQAAPNDNKGQYFHSDYSNAGSADGLHHYIRIGLTEEQTLSEYDYMTLFYYNRNTANTRSPKAFDVEQSADKEQWERMYSQANDNSLDRTPAALNETGAMNILPGVRWVRFVVTNSDLTAAGHYVFALSEIGLKVGKYVAYPYDEVYPGVTAETIVEAKRQGNRAALAINSVSASVDSLDIAYKNLNTAYKALLAEMDPSNFYLTELIAATEELLATVGDMSESPEPISNDASLLYTNAEYTGATAADRLNWANLWDGDANTIFHSNYVDHTTADGAAHYIRVQIPEDIEQLDRFFISYTTRNQGTTIAPQEISIEVSPDCETWQEIAFYSEGLPTDANVAHTLPVLFAPADTRYVRFRVTKTGRSVSGYYFFNLGEFAVNKIMPVAEPKAEYVDVTPELMSDAYTKLQRANYVLTTSTSADDRDAARAALQPAYNALYDASQRVVGGSAIKEVNATLDNEAPIYDLQGHRILHAVPGRIYIQSSRKVVL